MTGIRFSTIFLSTCILAGVIIITPNAVDAGFFTDTVEELGYTSLGVAIVAAGETPTFAACFVTILHITGATGDILNVDVNKLQEKSMWAYFICSYGPSAVVFLLVILFIFVTCVCCKCLKWLCCGKDRYNPIQVIVSTKEMMRSQKFDDKVELIEGQTSPPSYIQMA